jgi:glucose/arabinose dehydrogenase
MKHLIRVVFSVTLVACTNTAISTGTVTPAINKTAAPAASPTTVIPSVMLPAETVNTIAFPDINNYEWQLLTRGLNRPLDIKSAADDSGRLFVVEKPGIIRIFQEGELLKTPFLNITSRVNDLDREQGLLGLAFHPSYKQNGYLYVNYIDFAGDTVISRFYAQGNSADSNSETVLLKIQQPYTNHNGGALAFGPDGYLYLGMGDGGGSGDPFGNAQNTNNLLGKILRIDVDHGNPYIIPSDNPFGNEVWAYGLRNPWRISFDRINGDLWIADVGEATWEEINYLPAGSPGGINFGWSIMEGNHGYDGVPQFSLRRPVAEYNHADGCSVSGGYIYRGSMPEWNGIYLYGDYCTGLIWGTIVSTTSSQTELLFASGRIITSFGEDEDGELYLASDSGEIYKLVKK